MKHLVTLGIVITCTTAVLATPMADHLAFFLIAGRIPFTGYIVSPNLMILFWVSLIPLCILAYKISTHGIWKTIESLGVFHQRQINRHVRWAKQRKDSLPLLMSSVILHIAANLPDSTSPTPELLFRRRFLTIPA